MFVTSGIALLIIAIQFCVGCVVGSFTAVLILRSRLTWRVAIATSIVTAVSLELSVGATSWASWHQDLWWTTKIADHSLPLVVIVTLSTAVITVLLSNNLKNSRIE